jgi:2,3-bisphosphoglycerate-dependent phosphoglycerate mutase
VPQPATLVLVRHGQSEWNLRQLYTGRQNPGLTPKGVVEARAAGRKLKQAGCKFDIAFTSQLLRARATLAYILAELDQLRIQTVNTPALNERDFGELTGMSRAQARERWGKHQLRIWRRSFDVPPPGGESLSDTAKRVLPFFHDEILPHVLAGRHVLATAHRHSLRVIIMAIEGLTESETLDRDIPTGLPFIYDLTGKASCKPRALLADGAESAALDG